MAEQLAYNIDCMEYIKTIPDKYFDLAVVDPVYGDVTQGGYMQGKGGENKAKRIEYHLALWNQEKTGKEYFKELFRVSKNQIIWGGNYFTESIGKDSQCWLIWDKCHPEGVSFADCEMAWTSFNSATRIFRYLWNGMIQQNMANKEVKIHPTQKPVALYDWIFKNYAKEGDKILDTHLGSGSSRIAAHKANLDFVGCEIDKTYFDKQEERFDRFTAQASLFYDTEQFEM